MRLFNTRTRNIEEFSPLTEDNIVRLYTCGPTVYNYAHIGNLRAYVFADILRKALSYNGFEINHVMNITDIGHLASDADSGEDKMTKGLLREGKALTLENMRSLAEFYTRAFNEDLKKLNILPPTGQYYASDYVAEDIELIERLEEKGYTYQTSDGVYFDTEKMPDYGVLWGGKRTVDTNHARIAENTEKKNGADFALWKFNESIGYPSPWGQGFPGWHIECSAMSMKFLGEQFDIHTGGIDHISIHHTNEIAQSECATGKKPFVNFWLHNEFVDTGGEKMAKSGGNSLTLNTLIEKNINPVAYRLWLLMAHYRTKVNFNWEALEASETALNRLYALYRGLGNEMGKISQDYRNKFLGFISDDLDTSRALALLWEVFKDETLSRGDKKATVLDFDRVLSLGFADLKEEEIPLEVLKLGEEREKARVNKDWAQSDALRAQINSLGYEVKDTPEGSKIHKLD